MPKLTCSSNIGYGDGRYGFGGYGGTLDFDNDSALAEAFAPTPLYVENGTDFEKLLCSLNSQLDRISNETQNVAQAHDVNNAEGENLDKFGPLVGIQRQENETDDHFRQRLKVAGRSTISSGTTDELMELSALAFETELDQLDFPVDLATNPAQFDIEVPSSVESSAVLDASEVATEMEKSVAAAHRVNITVV